ncbi:MAG: M14 family zinc carboxypeptidase [Planctomycetota bacterium]
MMPPLHEIARRAASGDLEESSALPLVIGESTEGRPIRALRTGTGPISVSVIAGSHPDEPVGPATARALAEFLQSDDASALREHATFSICGHVHPDGAARNAAWTKSGDWRLDSYLRHTRRDPPGDDREFNYPRSGEALDSSELHAENRAVAQFLAAGAPYDSHASLHGMAIAEGAWFLVDKQSSADSDHLFSALRRLTAATGLGIHHWDRKGEKGFRAVARGFSTTPTSVAMREHFLAQNDEATADLFRPSSMEFVASLGGEPRCWVSEVPLFAIDTSPKDHETPSVFLAAKDELSIAAFSLDTDRRDFDAWCAKYHPWPVPAAVASYLQLAMIFLSAGLVEPDALDERLAPRQQEP